MGAGLALEFALRYPDMFEDYKKKCLENRLAVGMVDYFKSDSKTIINFPTKNHFKFPSKMEWIEDGMQNFSETYEQYGIETVAFPRLGCSNGGLEWTSVKPLMEKYMEPLPVLAYICLDRQPFAEGKEREMVDAFNNASIVAIADTIKLTCKQRLILSECKPIKRFWQISKLQGIGSKTYANLFTYFYNSGADLQLSIFIC